MEYKLHIITILQPFIWVLVGFILSKFIDIKVCLAKVLLYILIPVTTFYSVSYYSGNLYSIIIVSLLIATLMTILGLAYSYYTKQGRIIGCIFGYYNIGWLGIPISNALYGHEGGLIMATALLGGTLYGNTIAVWLISSSLGKGLQKMFILPTTYAFILGLMNRYYYFLDESYIDNIYSFTKYSMTILGMSLVGMSFGSITTNISSYIEPIKLSIIRLFLSILTVGILCLACYNMSFLHWQEIKVIALIALLPIAANVVVLEYALSNTNKTAIMVATSTMVSMILLVILGSIIINY